MHEVFDLESGQVASKTERRPAVTSGKRSNRTAIKSRLMRKGGFDAKLFKLELLIERSILYELSPLAASI